MKKYSQKLLDKARRAIDAANDLHAQNHIEFAAGRAYYAMFYVAEALLNEKDLSFSKHGGVHGAFGEYYVKTGLFDGRYHRWLLMAFNRRIAGDYGVEVDYTPEEVTEMIQQAEEFLQAAKEYLGS